MNGNKTYEINIDVDLYRKITNSLNNIMGDLNGTLSKSKINPFSGELLTYYNSLENNVSSKLESIIGEIEELGLKIDTSINTYQNIDEELRFGLDSIVDKIFEVGNGGGISIEFDGLSTYQERKEYLEKLIESYTTTLEELKKEYNNLYGNGIVIEYHEQFQNWFTIVTSLGGVNNFNSGLGNIYNQNGNLDIDNLSIILNFYKENNLNVKLKNYIIDGKSWSDSGLSSFNDNELTDNENEFNFLYSIYDSFGISSNEYVENIFFDGYDSYNEENINTAKSFLSQKMDFNLFGKLNETYTDCITKQADIINLQSAIYNYEQYQKLMPFEEARRNIDYLDYISKDYSNYDNDILNGNMYGGKYKDYLNYMDQSEVALYDYIYTKQGSDIAETYLFALTDTINQRKGFEKASNYVSNLNQNGLDAGDFFASGWEGFKDGNITFFNGICNFFTADGVVSAFDYEMIYKMQLLSSDEDMKQLLSSDEYMKQLLSSDEYKNYTNNLSDEAKKFLSYNYQINNSIGNMTIPMLVSFVPVVGKSASSALMWTSSTGNATEQAMQGGASKSTAYLYGGLSGLSEVAFEKIMGGIPGLSDGVGVGFKGIFKDMVSEGNEEYLQTWVDALLRSTILGEKIDVSSVSGEAMESFGMGMAVSGQMKVGMAGPAKIIDVGVSKMTNGVFNDYNSYNLNTELELSNDAIDVTESIVNNEGLHNMPDLQNVANVTFDPNSGMYRVQFSDGKIRFVDDVSDLSNSSLKTFNPSLSNVVTDEEVINKSSINETVVNHNAPSTSPNNFFNFTFNFNAVQEKIKNTTGAILTKVGDVGDLLKGFVLNTAMAEENIDVIDDINIEETIVNINTENNTTNLSKPSINFKIDFASIKEKIRNTTGAVLTKVGEVGNLLKGFVLNTAMADEKLSGSNFENSSSDIRDFTNTKTLSPSETEACQKDADTLVQVVAATLEKYPDKNNFDDIRGIIGIYLLYGNMLSFTRSNGMRDLAGTIDRARLYEYFKNNLNPNGFDAAVDEFINKNFLKNQDSVLIEEESQGIIENIIPDNPEALSPAEIKECQTDMDTLVRAIKITLDKHSDTYSYDDVKEMLEKYFYQEDGSKFFTRENGARDMVGSLDRTRLYEYFKNNLNPNGFDAAVDEFINKNFLKNQDSVLIEEKSQNIIENIVPANTKTLSPSEIVECQKDMNTLAKVIAETLKRYPDKNNYDDIGSIIYGYLIYGNMLSFTKSNGMRDLASTIDRTRLYEYFKNYLNPDGYNAAVDEFIYINLNIGKSEIDSGYFGFIKELDKKTLLQILPYAYEHGFDSIPDLAYTDFEVEQLVRKYIKIDNILKMQKRLEIWSKTEIKNLIREYFASVDTSSYIQKKIETLGNVCIFEDEETYRKHAPQDSDGCNNGINSYIMVNEYSTFEYLSGVSIHESLHQLSHIKVNSFFEKNGVEEYKRKIKYRGINESITELFAIEIMKEKGYAPKSCGYYEPVQYLRAILQMNIPGLNIETLKKAYINNDISLIKNAIDKVMGARFFEKKLVPAFDHAIKYQIAELDKVLIEMKIKMLKKK